MVHDLYLTFSPFFLSILVGLGFILNLGMEKERKRKMEGEEGGGEDEEEQIQKFYALIRSTKDMRDRLRKIPDESKEREEERKAAVVWNPTFQAEDFMEDDKSKDLLPRGTQAGPSSKTQQQQEDETKGKGETTGIDLNLSL